MYDMEELRQLDSVGQVFYHFVCQKNQTFHTFKNMLFPSTLMFGKAGKGAVEQIYKQYLITETTERSPRKQIRCIHTRLHNTFEACKLRNLWPIYKVRVGSFHNNKLQRKKASSKSNFTEQINAYLLHAKILTLTLRFNTKTFESKTTTLQHFKNVYFNVVQTWLNIWDVQKKSTLGIHVHTKSIKNSLITEVYKITGSKKARL